VTERLLLYGSEIAVVGILQAYWDTGISRHINFTRGFAYLFDDQNKYVLYFFTATHSWHSQLATYTMSTLSNYLRSRQMQKFHHVDIPQAQMLLSEPWPTTLIC